MDTSNILGIISCICVVITLATAGLMYSSTPGATGKNYLKLLVAAGIIAGVVFGIIQLVSALTDPCMHQPGTQWSKSLKKCVPDSCPDGGFMCKSTGNCVSKDYCDYTDHISTGQYSYDEESCECTLICPISGEEPYLKNSSQTVTKMHENPSDPTKYIPDNKLLCGTPCDISDTHHCEQTVNTICGRYIKWDGTQDIEDEYKKMCLPDDDNFEKCSGQNPQNVYCPNGKCISNEEGDARCPMSVCGKDSNSKGKVFICDKYNNNKDCDPSGNCTNCICSDIEVSGTEISKQFKRVGYCTNTTRNSGNNRCVDKDKIGEYQGIDDKTSFMINKQYDICSDGQGISLAWPQCPAGHIKDTPCTKFGICPNGWEAAPNSEGQYCLSNPEPYTVSNDEEVCCAGGAYQHTSLGAICCVEANNTDCLNRTNYPYSKKSFKNDDTILPDTKIPCKGNDSKYIDSMNEQLLNTLQLNESEKELAKDSKSPFYTSFYCQSDGEGSSDSHLYAFCGKDYNKIIYTTYDSSQYETSFCHKKGVCLLESTPTMQPREPITISNDGTKSYNIPICKTADAEFWGGTCDPSNPAPACGPGAKLQQTFPIKAGTGKLSECVNNQNTCVAAGFNYVSSL